MIIGLKICRTFIWAVILIFNFLSVQDYMSNVFRRRIKQNKIKNFDEAVLENSAISYALNVAFLFAGIDQLITIWTA
jgi:hypothetical protein